MSDKVVKETFKEFLSLIQLKGTVETNELLLESSKDSITALTRSMDKSFGLRGIYKGNFEDKSEIGILRFDSFISYVEQMDTDFEISYKGNKINLTTKKTKISTPMQTKEIITNKLEPEKFRKIIDKLNGGIEFTISEETMKDMVKKYSVIPSEEIIIKGKDGKLYLSLSSEEDQTKFHKEYEVENLKKDFAISINKKFIDLLACIKIPVKINIVYTDDIKGLSVKVNKDCYNLEYIFSLNDYDETEKAGK